MLVVGRKVVGEEFSRWRPHRVDVAASVVGRVRLARRLDDGVVVPEDLLPADAEEQVFSIIDTLDALAEPGAGFSLGGGKEPVDPGRARLQPADEPVDPPVVGVELDRHRCLLPALDLPEREALRTGVALAELPGNRDSFAPGITAMNDELDRFDTGRRQKQRNEKSAKPAGANSTHGKLLHHRTLAIYFRFSGTRQHTTGPPDCFRARGQPR